jgi:hypothetical protein
MSTENRRSGFLNSRAVRYFVTGLGILFVLAAVVVLGVSLFKSAHNHPLNVDIYPGAKLLRTGQNKGSDISIYSSQDAMQKVFDFYAGRFPKDDPNGCNKIYTDKTPSEEPGHWFGGCIDDESVLDIAQVVSVTINYEKVSGATQAQTVIKIERDWGGG